MASRADDLAVRGDRALRAKVTTEVAFARLERWRGPGRRLQPDESPPIKGRFSIRLSP